MVIDRLLLYDMSNGAFEVLLRVILTKFEIYVMISKSHYLLKCCKKSLSFFLVLNVSRHRCYVYDLYAYE